MFTVAAVKKNGKTANSCCWTCTTSNLQQKLQNRDEQKHEHRIHKIIGQSKKMRRRCQYFEHESIFTCPSWCALYGTSVPQSQSQKQKNEPKLPVKLEWWKSCRSAPPCIVQCVSSGVMISQLILQWQMQECGGREPAHNQKSATERMASESHYAHQRSRLFEERARYKM